MDTTDFYFAGELFDAKHLTGNAMLADAIATLSAGKYKPVLPQDLEFRSAKAHDIRDEDILALLSCPLALFHFDGTELDSGTVSEFMIAKFADIPSVILRSDFRAAGDQEIDPWNLMLSFYPRTERVVFKTLEVYKSQPSGQSPMERVKNLNNRLAQEIIDAFEKVLAQPALLMGNDQAVVFRWMEKLFNFDKTDTEIHALYEKVLHLRNSI